MNSIQRSLTDMYRIEGGDDVYAPIISNLVASEFPQPDVLGKSQLLDILTDVIIGTGQIRFGPKPNPESTVMIRNILREYILRDEPIPMLVPWGSVKVNGGGVDVAELSALRMIQCLNERIKAHYSPGGQYNMRIEDTSGIHLFHDNIHASEQTDLYTNGLESLIRVIGYDKFITTKRESKVVTPGEFIVLADELIPLFFCNIKTRNEKSIAALKAEGWRGEGIPEETIQHYMRGYEKLYPNWSIDKKQRQLARYFAGSLTRVKLGIKGDSPEWNGKFLDLSFVPPIAGQSNYFASRVHYRVMPATMTRQHMPPWRAKGYVRVNTNDEARFGIASFADPINYNPYIMHLTDGIERVPVRADYVLEIAKGDSW